MWYRTVPWPCTGGWFTRATSSCTSAPCQCVHIKHPASTTWDPTGSESMVPPGDKCWAADPAITGGLCAQSKPGGPESVLSSCSSPSTASREPASQWQVVIACPVAGYSGGGAVVTESSSPTATPLHEWGDSWDPGCATTGGGRPSDPARCFAWGSRDWLRRVWWGPWGARADQRPVSEAVETSCTLHPATSCAADSPLFLSPAFSALSSPALSVDLTTAGSLLASLLQPPASSPRPDRDPVLAEPSPVGPPRPTRSLWDEFTPITPCRNLPPSARIPSESRVAELQWRNPEYLTGIPYWPVWGR